MWNSWRHFTLQFPYESLNISRLCHNESTTTAKVNKTNLKIQICFPLFICTTNCAFIWLGKWARYIYKDTYTFLYLQDVSIAVWLFCGLVICIPVALLLIFLLHLSFSFRFDWLRYSSTFPVSVQIRYNLFACQMERQNLIGNILYISNANGKSCSGQLNYAWNLCKHFAKSQHSRLEHVILIGIMQISAH